MSASGGMARSTALRREECLHVSDLELVCFLYSETPPNSLVTTRTVKRRLSTRVPSSAGSSKLARLEGRNERGSKSPSSSVSGLTTRGKASLSRAVRTSRSSSDCMATFASSGKSKTCTCTGTQVSLLADSSGSAKEEQENSTLVCTRHRQRPDPASKRVSRTKSKCLPRSNLLTVVSSSVASTSRAIAT